MFEIGQQIVCIDDKFHPEIAKLFDALPIENKTYTVRDILIGVKHPEKVGDVRILLRELTNPSPNGNPKNERGFSETRFKPLDEIETSEINKNTSSIPYRQIKPELVPLTSTSK